MIVQYTLPTSVHIETFLLMMAMTMTMNGTDQQVLISKQNIIFVINIDAGE